MLTSKHVEQNLRSVTLAGAREQLVKDTPITGIPQELVHLFACLGSRSKKRQHPHGIVSPTNVKYSSPQPTI